MIIYGVFATDGKMIWGSQFAAHEQWGGGFDELVAKLLISRTLLTPNLPKNLSWRGETREENWNE